MAKNRIQKVNICVLIKVVLKKYWFIAMFVVTLIFPIYGGLLDKDMSLSGVTVVPEIVDASLENIADGSYQAYLNARWEEEFPGVKFLLKVRNQFLYSICRVSPNQNVVIGKKGYLFEPMYIYFETQTFAPSSEEYFNTLGRNLSLLQELLAQNNKELYIFITPSKAHFYREYIPNRFEFLSNDGLFPYTNYSKLIETLNQNNINYFDSISFIEQNRNSGILASPVFYKSGTHWNHTWGNYAAAEFLNYLNSCSRFDLASVCVEELASNEAIYPDTDLYSSLNLLADPKEKWYTTRVTISHEGNDHPNIFLRGGSFMGQSLNAIVKSNVFGQDVHFENNYYYTDQYSSSYTLSSFTAYDEIGLDSLMGQSDILVLEVNDGAIYTMGWGFIEYLLEHPNYLDKVY